MRTIGRKRPASSPRGDTRAMCSYCGVEWLASQLRRDRSGNWYCPDEGDGLDKKSLDEANAANSLHRRVVRAYRNPPRGSGSSNV